MTKKPAFTVSLVDMVRKLVYQYVDPVDYVANFISRLYSRDNEVEISVNEDSIKIHCSNTLNSKYFEELEQKQIIALTSSIPPIADYKTVVISSGNKRAGIDENRNISVESIEELCEGTDIEIQRTQQNENEEDRLDFLYGDSDMNVTLNGDLIGLDKEVSFEFTENGFSGAIYYDPTADGDLRFFKKGRFISDETFIKGLIVNLYEHGFNTTMTQTHVIVSGGGKSEYEKLQRTLPEILLGYLKSDQLQKTRKISKNSYQTILRAVLEKYEDVDYIKEEIFCHFRFSDCWGRIKDKYTLEYVREHPRLRLPPSEERIYEIISGEKRKLGHQYKLLENFRNMMNKAFSSKFWNTGKESHVDSQTAELIEKYKQECLILRDTLGIKDVLPIKSGNFEYKNKVLYVPVDFLDSNTELNIAVKAVPNLGFSKRKTARTYARIMNVASW